MKDGMSGIVGAMEKTENRDVLEDLVDLVRLELVFDLIDPKRCKGNPLVLFFAIGGRTHVSGSAAYFSSTRPNS